MRILIQRVTDASVTVDSETVGAIGPGYVVLVGIRVGDGVETAEHMAKRVAEIRLFPNAESPATKPIDTAIRDSGGAVLAVSQFTLYADTSRGRRPSFIAAAKSDDARPVFDAFVDALRREGIQVETGLFGAHMHVRLTNDGPVTIWLADEPADD